MIAGCPMELVDAGTWDVVQAAELAEKGTWPAAGGWLDQSASLLEGVRFVWREEAEWKARLRIAE